MYVCINESMEKLFLSNNNYFLASNFNMSCFLGKYSKVSEQPVSKNTSGQQFQ